MGLGANVIGTWDEMQTLFLEKYKDYCKESDPRGDEIFRISQKEDETLEDYVSCFLYIMQKNPQHVLAEDSQKLIFLRGVNNNCLEALDLMASGDISQISWDDLKKIYLNYSRSTMKKGRGYQSTVTKGISQGISKLKISNLLSFFKKDIINDVATHRDTITTKKKHAKIKSQFVEYCPHCHEQKKDYRCKLVANLDNQHLSTKYMKMDGDNDQVFFISQNQPWALR